MKQVFALFAGLLTILSACTSKNGTGNFTINGKLINHKAQKAFLEEVPVGMTNPLLLDSAQIKEDGTFTLKAGKKDATIYNIRLDNGQYPVASVVNDAAKVDLTITMRTGTDYIDHYEVKGSPASQTMLDYLGYFALQTEKLFKDSKALDSLGKLKGTDSLITQTLANRKAVAEGLHNYALTEIKKTNNPALGLFELGYYQSLANQTDFGLHGLELNDVKTIIDGLIKSNPNHTAIAKLKQDLSKEAEEAAGASWTGKQAPDFTLPDVNGKPVALSSFKGKYVLVDFWASWCGPCRKENPNVVAAYNKFKNKNFAILGVSLDQEKSAWLAAIQKDGLGWQQVSDLKYWDSPVVGLYKFNGIPFNILIDPQGKVIAEGLRGGMLEAKLQEVL